MKKGLLIGLLLLAGCTQTSTKIDESIPANQMFTGMNTNISKISISATDDAIYYIDSGTLYVYDDAMQESLKLADLNYIDDEVVSVSQDYELEYEKYFDIMDGEYFQCYGGSLYYISYYGTIEGENGLMLNRLDSEGLNKEVVYTFDTVPDKMFITYGHLFYVDTFTQEVFVVNLNSKEKTQIIEPEGQRFLRYVPSQDGLYLNMYNQSTNVSTLYAFSFDDYSLENVISAPDYFLASSYDSNFIYYEIQADKILAHVVNEAGDVRTTFEHTVMEYIDDQYIYATSAESPLKFQVYDYDGTLVYEVEASESFVPSNSLDLNGSKVEVSGIIGVFKDTLVVVANDKNDGLGYYTVNYKTGEWTKIATSSYLNALDN
ncbi:hypothetical protein AOC36_09300 [Erysipelothrix larvae]|uniref:DUF5050 domain-containing protein n=1 Tax=Erysipelothrix larvae TaxID=1514105 RepID=A0A0X8H164_9FIRM|nr:hypothetical protein [Erysipelothrix larvae]AMC94178.1 hypothetical protein AOC36_09300 [Erysipelothrix larvae]